MSINSALSVSSDFSIGQSLLQIPSLVSKAKELGYQTVALVDDMTLNGLIEFNIKCKNNEIKPITGCRLRVYDNSKLKTKDASNTFVNLKVYIKTEKGLQSLFKLLSEANDDSNFYYHSRTDMNAVLQLEDVIVTTGDMFGLFSHPQAVERANQLKERFGDDFYVELNPINTPLFDRVNALAVKYAQENHVKTLVTHSFYYLDNEDADTLDVLSAIATNTKLDVSYRAKQYVKDFAMFDAKGLVERSKKAIERLAKYEKLQSKQFWIDGLKNTKEIEEKCIYTFQKKDVCLPKFADNPDDEYEILQNKCVAGWKKRFDDEVLGYKPTQEQLRNEYRPRLIYELKILRKMGFVSYFLLVEELVMWSKNNGVSVGCGRGSSAGSLVAYLLGITDIDPIRFNLIFERFINPERLDLPDIDLDFASSKRYKVVEYLTEKYGKDRVAGISNYATLASASALRDTGRIYGLTPIDLQPTKSVVRIHGASLSLNESADAVAELDAFRKTYPEIWKHSVKLEGVMKALGQHAAGIIVAGEPINNRAVLENRSEGAVVNWDKRSVEDWGLIKMDLLGLATLDTLTIAKDYIKERHGVEIDYLKISLDDEKTLQSLSRGETTGVFQLESGGMRDLLKSVANGGTLSFEDICAVTALYRPGPMDSGMLDDYVAVKQGLKPVFYEHDNMKEALKDTMGIMVYQEQVMRISKDVAGYSGAEADSLRKIIGKKQVDKMQEQREKFVNGAVLGYAEVELENGKVVKVHRATKFAVKEVPEKLTIEEIMANNYTLLHEL